MNKMKIPTHLVILDNRPTHLLNASGIPVELKIVKCRNINHQNHKHTYFHEPHGQNDKSNICYNLCDCDD